MSTRDEQLERLIRDASARDPIPEFEAVWRRAQARRAQRGARGGRWQWALGPLVAAVSAAVVIVAVRGLPLHEAPTAPVAAGRQVGERSLVAVADAGAGANTARAEEPKAVASDAAAEGLYVAGTDFLLEMEIPAWN